MGSFLDPLCIFQHFTMGGFMTLRESFEWSDEKPSLGRWSSVNFNSSILYLPGENQVSETKTLVSVMNKLDWLNAVNIYVKTSIVFSCIRSSRIYKVTYRQTHSHCPKSLSITKTLCLSFKISRKLQETAGTVVNYIKLHRKTRKPQVNHFNSQ